MTKKILKGHVTGNMKILLVITDFDEKFWWRKPQDFGLLSKPRLTYFLP